MEEWKDLEFLGYPAYGISNKGQVFSYKLNRLLNQSIATRGYRKVTLRSKTGSTFQFVHRLVALAFLPNPKNYSIVSHKDDNKTNNHVDNLEWTNYEGNASRSINNGTKPRGETHYKTKISDVHVLFIRNHYKQGDKKFGASALSKHFNVSLSTIADIVHNRTHRHVIQSEGR